MNPEVEVMLSNRHIHLNQSDLDILFGEGYQLTKLRDIGMQFAAVETVTLEGPKGSIEKVRILGPLRNATQAELLASDCFKLGISAPYRDSGDLRNAAPLTIIGPAGKVESRECGIIALRHIHVGKNLALEFGVQEGQKVDVITHGSRAVTFHNVLIRLSKGKTAVMHVDLEEGNAAGVNNHDMVKIVLPKGEL